MAPRTKGLKATSSPRKTSPSTSKLLKTASRDPQTISDSTTATEPTRPASSSSSAAVDSFSTANTPTSIAAKTPSVTQQPSSASSPRPAPTTTEAGPIIALECQVKHIKFTLTESEFNTILHLPTVTPSTLSQTKARNRCLTEFSNPHSQANPAHLSYLILKQDPRLLYYIIVRTMLPKPNSTDSVNTKTLELIYLLMTRKPINFARYILGVMSKFSFIQHPASLPYATLLTLVFNHFGVCLTHEIKETKPVSIITLASLKHIQFFKTESREWKFIEDVTQEEIVRVFKKFSQHVKPCLSSPQITPPPSLVDHILNLDEKVYKLQETVNKLEYIMTISETTKELSSVLRNSLYTLLNYGPEQRSLYIIFLITCEYILPLVPNSEDVIRTASHFNLSMVMGPNGRERTEAEFEASDKAVGFEGFRMASSYYDFKLMEFIKKN
ncbi:hypothetical protein Cgig2_002225 [Carnegiea gigantea]|uniref:Uncharacterized protein n=1 Tax=Carnegiea gigantea TaxID=171969 RepID=A0A9Q1QNM8_9CARY|nr:hypothetical protein Cgig2_002225 [Carnegiea gigantea]